MSLNAASSNSDTCRVLIFSRDADWYGGVVNFIETLRLNLAPEIVSKQFLIGRRKNKLGKILRPVTPVFDAIRLLTHVIANRYDCYHLNPSLNGPSLIRDGLFLFVLKITGCNNIIACFHGWELTTEKTIESSAWRRWLFFNIYGRVDCTLVLAQQFKDWLITQGYNENTVLVFTTMFDGNQITNKKRSNLTGNDEINLLFLSRFVREKGIFELLEAFRKISTKYNNVYLIFAGTGPDEKAMQDWVVKEGLTDKIEFKGYVRNTDKAKVLKESNIFVFPTYYGEGCPVSLLEAMAAGMAIITTPVGGIPDIIENSKNGILLNEVTIASVQDAIEELLLSPDRICEMGDINRVEAWEKYDAPVVTRFFEGVYKGGCNSNA